MSEESFYHVGLAVTDIDAAMHELSAARGITWAKVTALTIEGHALKFTYSVEGPPHIELIEGEPGGPWDASGGPHTHHVGLFTSDLKGDRARMEEAGMKLDLAGRGFTYHWGGMSGVRLELVAEGTRPAFERWLAGGDFI